MAVSVPPSAVLLLADDPLQRSELVRALLNNGLQVLQRPLSRRGRQHLPAGRPDPNVMLLVLHWPSAAGDPEMALILVKRWRRSDGITPLLLLLDQADEDQRACLLDGGADDVLVQPFGLSECVARCRAILRRSPSTGGALAPPPLDPGDAVLQLGAIQLDRRQCRVTLAGEEVALTPREFRLLECFMQHPGQALSREQLIAQVWGPDYTGDNKSVDVHVLWLRRKLASPLLKPQLFITVRGVGYRLDPPLP
jgi:two-component system phosphate regulon response regulator PhoB